MLNADGLSSMTASSWPLELKRRMAAALICKMLATTVGISAFFVAYFWVLNNPLGPVLIMPLTALDRSVPIGPWALPLYFSLWLYVSLAPALLRDARELARFGAAAFVLGATGLLIFLLWPTSTPDFDVDWNRYPSMAFLKDVDASANACPSLHVGFAVFTGLHLDRLLREIRMPQPWRLLNLLWCAGIVYSTLAIRQHVVLDVLAGGALGAAAALLHPGLLRRQARAMTNTAEPATRGAFEGAFRRALSWRRPEAADPAVSGAAPSRTDPVAGRLRSG